MDPIHPIRPISAQPAAVRAVRRVTRAAEEREREPADREGARRPPAAPPVAEADEPHAHVDARV
jgi:hypothetical protein